MAGSLAPAKGAAAGTAEVERHLRSAWGTELLLEMTGAFIDDELVGLANNWTVVQSYYAAYHAFLALLAAQGAALPAHHEGTQRAWAIFWTGRRLDLPPWALGYGPKGGLNVKGGKPCPTRQSRVCGGADVTLPNASAPLSLAAGRSCRLPVAS